MTLEIPSYGVLRVVRRERGVLTAIGTHGGNDVLVRVIEVRPDDGRWLAVCDALAPGPPVGVHPAVVAVTAIGRLPDGRPWVALDAVDDDHLGHRIAVEGRLDPATALRHTVDVAGALATAHHQGMVHGGVAPERLLTLRSGRVRLADFGMARVVSDTRLGGRPEHLDPAHVAPDVLEHAPVAAGADVHALASTMVHMLTGRPPAALTDHDPEPVLIMRKLAGEVAQLPGRVPAALARLVRETVLAPAHDRPSMAAFAHALADQAARMGIEGIEPRIDRVAATPPPDRAAVDPSRPVTIATPIWSDDPEPTVTPHVAASAPDVGTPSATRPAPATPPVPTTRPVPTTPPPTVPPPGGADLTAASDALPTGGFWQLSETPTSSGVRPAVVRSVVGGLIALLLLALVIWTLLT